MLDEITWEQFQEWLAYEVIEPFGDRRADWQFASVCAVMANSAAMTSGSRKRFKVSDFLLEFDDKEKAQPSAQSGGGQTWQQQKMLAKMFATVANVDEAKRLARVKRDEERRTRRPAKSAERKPTRPTKEQIAKVRAALPRGK